MSGKQEEEFIGKLAAGAKHNCFQRSKTDE